MVILKYYIEEHAKTKIVFILIFQDLKGTMELIFVIVLKARTLSLQVYQKSIISKILAT